MLMYVTITGRCYSELTVVQKKSLLSEGLSDEEFFRLRTDTNKSLHCMAAHLHRYKTELTFLSNLFNNVRRYNREFPDELVEHGVRGQDTLHEILSEIKRIRSQLFTVSMFSDELQQDIDTMLALVSILDVNRSIRDFNDTLPRLKQSSHGT